MFWSDKKVSNSGRKSTVTFKKIKELGVKVNSRYLSYKPSTEAILIRDQKTKRYAQVKASEVGDDLRAAFYAAAGIRNYMLRYDKLPDEKQRNKILARAKHTHDTQEIWSARKKYTDKKNPFRKEVEVVARPEQRIEIPTERLNDLGEEKATSKNIEDKPKTEKRTSMAKVEKTEGKLKRRKSSKYSGRKNEKAAQKIKELGLDLDPTCFTYRELKHGSSVVIRIPTEDNKHAINTINSKLVGGDETLLFVLANDVLNKMIELNRQLTKDEIKELAGTYVADAPKKQDAKKKQSAKKKRTKKVKKAKDEVVGVIVDERPKPSEVSPPHDVEEAKKSIWQAFKSWFS